MKRCTDDTVKPCTANNLTSLLAVAGPVFESTFHSIGQRLTMTADQSGQNALSQRLKRCNAGYPFPEAKLARITRKSSLKPLPDADWHVIGTFPRGPIIPENQPFTSRAEPRRSCAPKWLRNVNNEVVENPWRSKSGELPWRESALARACELAEVQDFVKLSAIPPEIYVIPQAVDTYFPAITTSPRGNSLPSLTSPIGGAPSPQRTSSALLFSSLPKIPKMGGSFRNGYKGTLPRVSISSTCPEKWLTLPDISQFRRDWANHPLPPVANVPRAPVASSQHIDSVRHLYPRSCNGLDVIQQSLPALQPTSWRPILHVGREGGFGTGSREGVTVGGFREDYLVGGLTVGNVGGGFKEAAVQDNEDGEGGPDLWTSLLFDIDGVGTWEGLGDFGDLQPENPVPANVIPDPYSQVGPTIPLVDSGEAQGAMRGVMRRAMEEKYEVLNRLLGANVNASESYFGSNVGQDVGGTGGALPLFQGGRSDIYQQHLELSHAGGGIDGRQNEGLVQNGMVWEWGPEWWKEP